MNLLKKWLSLEVKKNGQLIPPGYFDLSVPHLNGNEHYKGGGYSKRIGIRRTTNTKHPFCT
jgi:hypothetical protein